MIRSFNSWFDHLPDTKRFWIFVSIIVAISIPGIALRETIEGAGALADLLTLYIMGWVLALRVSAFHPKAATGMAYGLVAILLWIVVWLY